MLLNTHTQIAEQEVRRLSQELDKEQTRLDGALAELAALRKAQSASLALSTGWSPAAVHQHFNVVMQQQPVEVRPTAHLH